MARAKISRWGDAVILKLSFRESAALHALLSRVDPETNEGIHEDTEETFLALERITDEVDPQLWPQDHEAFRMGTEGLVDPGSEREQQQYDLFDLEPHPVALEDWD